MDNFIQRKEDCLTKHCDDLNRCISIYGSDCNRNGGKKIPKMHEVVFHDANNRPVMGISRRFKPFWIVDGWVMED